MNWIRIALFFLVPLINNELLLTIGKVFGFRAYFAGFRRPELFLLRCLNGLLF